MSETTAKLERQVALLVDGVTIRAGKIGIPWDGAVYLKHGGVEYVIGLLCIWDNSWQTYGWNPKSYPLNADSIADEALRFIRLLTNRNPCSPSPGLSECEGAV